MKRFLYIIKISLSLFFLLGSLLIYYLLFFSSKERRFSFAERTQGQNLSQKIFNVLIFQDPKFSDAYFEKSVAHNKRGNYDEGFKLLNKAVELDPKLHLGYRGWLKYHKVKDYNGCISDLKKLDSLTPNFVDAPWGDNIHYVLGLAYKGLQKNDLALLEFNKALMHDDSSFVNTNLFLHKGIICYQGEKFEEALRNFEAYRKINYNNVTPEYCYWKGKVFNALQKNDSTLILLKQSKELYLKGYKNKDIYNEVQDELYLSDIEQLLNKLNDHENTRTVN